MTVLVYIEKQNFIIIYIDNCLIFHICKEDKPIIYMRDSEIGPVPQACPIPQTSSIIL